MFDNYLVGLNCIEKTVSFSDVVNEGSIIGDIVENHYHKYRLIYDMIKGIQPSIVEFVRISVSNVSLELTLQSKSGSSIYEFLEDMIPDDSRFALRLTEMNNGDVNIYVENIGYSREDDMPYEN